MKNKINSICKLLKRKGHRILQTMISALFTESKPSIFRTKIGNHFSSLFNDEKLGKNIEVSIYNYSIQEANYRQIIKKWDNPQFCDIYSARLKTILYNINTNSEFKYHIQTNQITPTQLTHLTHQEMNPSIWKDMIEMKIKRDRSRFSTNIEASTDMFQCRKCKSKKCTYYEMQTRSADEPATIFITCLDCGKNWKN